MATKTHTHRHCIQHSRFTTQDGWLLFDVSLSLSGNIAVSCYNKDTRQTSIDVYSVRTSDIRDTPKIVYSKEFEKYESDGTIHRGRRVSYVGDDVLTCVGNKLEVLQVSKDEVLRSRRVKDSARCLSVREGEILFAFKESNKITLYNVVDFNETKSIILQGIQDGYYPYDMTATGEKICACVSDGKERRALIFEEKNGKFLSELKKPTDANWYAQCITVSETLGVVAVVWRDSKYNRDGTCYQIVFYSLLSENICSFLMVDIDDGVFRIRISERGDMIVTGNTLKGKLKIYDMVDLFTYGSLKKHLVTHLQREECVKFARFFSLSKDQTNMIEKTGNPAEFLLFALEEKGVVQESNVVRLTEAFHELKIRSSCCQVTDIYQKTRRSAFSKEARSNLKKSFKLMINQSGTTMDRQETASNRVGAPWSCHKASDGRIYYYNSVTKQAMWENPESPKSKTESIKNKKDLYVNLSPTRCEFLPESSFEDEFAKLSVRVSEKLTKANCVKLATYFNFPVNKIDLIRNDIETPGITLFDIMKERNIVDKDNVADLKEALEDLDLIDITENLVIPYQRRIERLKFQRGYFK